MYTIKALANKTGLTGHTLRAWERRYRAITPDRTASNRRLYSEAQVDRAVLLAAVVKRGHAISQVASMTTEELRQVAGEPSALPKASPKGLDLQIHEFLEATRRLDSRALDRMLIEATVELGLERAILHFACPTLQRVGEEWRHGELRPAHEHLASASMRTWLGRTLQQCQAGPGCSRLVATTLPGHQHELGALMGSVIAASRGWEVHFLGPNLPTEDISLAVQRLDARAVLLSVVHLNEPVVFRMHLDDLLNQLASQVTVIVGGRAAPDIANDPRTGRTIFLESLDSLTPTLEALELSVSAR